MIEIKNGVYGTAHYKLIDNTNEITKDICSNPQFFEGVEDITSLDVTFYKYTLGFQEEVVKDFHSELYDSIDKSIFNEEEKKYLDNFLESSSDLLAALIYRYYLLDTKNNYRSLSRYLDELLSFLFEKAVEHPDQFLEIEENHLFKLINEGQYFDHDSYEYGKYIDLDDVPDYMTEKLIVKIKYFESNDLEKLLEYHYEKYTGEKENFLFELDRKIKEEYNRESDYPYINNFLGLQPVKHRAYKENLYKTEFWISKKLIDLRHSSVVKEQKKKGDIITVQLHKDHYEDFYRPKTADSLKLLFWMLYENKFFNEKTEKQHVQKCFEILTGHSGDQLKKIIGSDKDSIKLKGIKVNDYNLIIRRLGKVLKELEEIRESLE